MYKHIKLKIGHLFPDTMNIYGDIGNVICLKNRVEWRMGSVEVVNLDSNNLSTYDLNSIDIFFMGGGQDKEQLGVGDYLVKNGFGNVFTELVAHDKTFLLICGGYQLFGKKYIGQNGEIISGLGALDMETYALSNSRYDRCIGNIVIETTLPLDNKRIVGFENHSGQTRFNIEHLPFGKVLYGFGDNFDGFEEGVVHRNLIGTYLHGPLLPKNPGLADYLIRKSTGIELLAPLDDFSETRANNFIQKKYLK